MSGQVDGKPTNTTYKVELKFNRPIIQCLVYQFLWLYVHERVLGISRTNIKFSRGTGKAS